jgi:hypothetical protein
MANPAQLRILKQGPEVWNTWRRQAGNSGINLGEADLTGDDLRGARSGDRERR